MTYQAFSGGAQGADKQWEAISKKLGLPITFTHYRPQDAASLKIENKQIVDAAIHLACQNLGKAWPSTSLDLIRRNYLIARACDKLWAIGSMILAPNGWAAEHPYGGTGWGVEFARELGKQIVFFDQLKETWWWYHQEFLCWMPLEGILDSEQEYLLTPKPGLIGTRHLSKAGLAAIEQVLSKTKQRDDGQD